MSLTSAAKSFGAGVAALLWILGSIGFSLYVNNFGSYNKTYGALAGVVVLMLWLFLTSYIVLLGAHAHGLVGYWRTPGVLRSDEGRAAVGLPDNERFVALIYLGHPRQEQAPPERAPSGEYVTYLA